MRDWFTVLGKIFGFVFFIMCLYVGAFMLMAVAMMLGLSMIGCEETIEEYDIDAGYLKIQIKEITAR